MREHCLFIDELGNPDPKSRVSDIYVLCGCSVPELAREKLRVWADQIKFKYWGNTRIIFHSREIGRSEGVFSIFKDNDSLKSEFEKDLLAFMVRIPITIFVVIVNKTLSRRKGWGRVKIIKETSSKLIYHFLALLLGNKSRGRIVIESATAEKDSYYLNAFSYFLSPGLKEISVDYKIVQRLLTSISFVTKNNYDIEEQLADLFAYGARCKYLKEFEKAKFEKESYEGKLISVFEKKLFVPPKNARGIKARFYEKIVPFSVLPKS